MPWHSLPIRCSQLPRNFFPQHSIFKVDVCEIFLVFGVDFQNVDGQIRCPRKFPSARSHVPPEMPTFAKFRLLQDRETRIFQLPSRCTRKRPSTAGVVLITHSYMLRRKRRTRNGASCVMLDGALFDIGCR